MGTRRRTTAQPSARQARELVAQARSGGRRSALLWTAATMAAVAVILVVVIVTIRHTAGRRSADGDMNGLSHSPATVAVGAERLPPWPAPADVSSAVRAAGLPMLSAEGGVEHIHAHLDVIVDGRTTPVPAGLGIDTKNRHISPLHTHDDSGVIHIESPVRRKFSLGEFFSEWQVSLSADNIGGLRSTGGNKVRVFVNGALRQGNPAAITFDQHDEVALVYGTPQPGEIIPARYDFAAGD